MFWFQALVMVAVLPLFLAFVTNWLRFLVKVPMSAASDFAVAILAIDIALLMLGELIETGMAESWKPYLQGISISLVLGSIVICLFTVTFLERRVWEAVIRSASAAAGFQYEGLPSMLVFIGWTLVLGYMVFHAWLLNYSRVEPWLSLC